MRILLFFLLLITVSISSAIGQTVHITHDSKAETLVYYIKDSVLVENKDSADYVFVISPPEAPDTNLFIIRSFFPSGKIRSVAKSSTNSFNVKYQGSYLEFYENGHKKAIENYNKGHLEGDIYEFYPNGNLYTVKTYSKSNGFRFHECRDSTGKLLVENGNGHLLKFDKNFKTVVMEGEIKNEQEDGEWTGVDEDSVKTVYSFKKGKLLSRVYYDYLGKKYDSSPAIPRYKDGTDALFYYLGKHIKYSKLNNPKFRGYGRMFVYLDVNADGSLSNIKVMRTTDETFNDEIVRVLKTTSPWIPARKKDKAIAYSPIILDIDLSRIRLHKDFSSYY